MADPTFAAIHGVSKRVARHAYSKPLTVASLQLAQSHGLGELLPYAIHDDWGHSEALNSTQCGAEFPWGYHSLSVVFELAVEIFSW